MSPPAPLPAFPSLGLGPASPWTTHHGITDQVAHIALLKAAGLTGAIQVDNGFPQLLGRIIIQFYPPFVNVCFYVRI